MAESSRPGSVMAGLKWSFALICKDYLKNCTMAGFMYLAKDGLRRRERVFWLLSLLGAFLSVVYYCWRLYENIEDDPIRTTIDPDVSGKYREFFPTVTICSIARLSKTKLDAVLRSERYRDVDPDLIEKALLYLVFPRLARNQTDVRIRYEKLMGHRIGTEDLVRIFISASPSCEEMIVDYKWGNVSGVGSEIFRRGMADIGGCCSFNAGSYAVPALGYHTDKVLPLAPTCGNGYLNGLQLTLNSNPDDYLITMTFYDGYKVLVHNHGELPVVYDHGFALSVGAMAIYSMGIIGFEYKKETMAVSLDKRNCYLEGERKLKYFDRYTEPFCVTECMLDSILRECQCRPSYMLIHQDIPYCKPNFQDYSCMDRNTNENRKLFFKKSCNCLPTCNRYWYVGEPSFAGRFPELGFNLSRTGKRVLALNGTNKVNNYDHLSYLVIYFNPELDEIYTRDLWYGPSVLIAVIGGLLGLGLGFSFISLVEMTYFLFRGCRLFCVRAATCEPNEN